MAIQTPSIVNKGIISKDVINVEDGGGANLVMDPSFDVGTPTWTTSAGWAIANGAAINNGAVGTLAQTIQV